MLNKLLKRIKDFYGLLLHRYRNRRRRRQKEKNEQYNHIYPMW